MHLLCRSVLLHSMDQTLQEAEARAGVAGNGCMLDLQPPRILILSCGRQQGKLTVASTTSEQLRQLRQCGGVASTVWQPGRRAPPFVPALRRRKTSYYGHSLLLRPLAADTAGADAVRRTLHTQCL